MCVTFCVWFCMSGCLWVFLFFQILTWGLYWNWSKLTWDHFETWYLPTLLSSMCLCTFSGLLGSFLMVFISELWLVKFLQSQSHPFPSFVTWLPFLLLIRTLSLHSFLWRTLLKCLTKWSDMFLLSTFLALCTASFHPSKKGKGQYLSIPVDPLFWMNSITVWRSTRRSLNLRTQILRKALRNLGLTKLQK